LYGILKRDGCIRAKQAGYDIFVKRVEGRKLVNAIFMRRDQNSASSGLTFDFIVWAREAQLRVDLDNRKIYVVMHDCYFCNSDGLDDGYVLDKEWPVELPEMANNSKERASQLDWWELAKKRDELGREEQQVNAEISAQDALVDSGNSSRRI